MIYTENLIKCCDPITAVDGVNLDVRQGQIHILLDLNEAGKATTIRMLTSILLPTASTAAGYDIVNEAEEGHSYYG